MRHLPRCSRSRPFPRSLTFSLAGVAFVAACDDAPDRTVVGPDPDPSASRGSATSAQAQTKGFRKHVTLAGVLEHLQAFQQHADVTAGHRAAGTAGHDLSAQYVQDRLTAAGYVVSLHEFTFHFTGDRTPPALARAAPDAAITYVDGVDFMTMQHSGNGDVTAPVFAVDLVLGSPPATANSSGCEAADFAGFTSGAIALIQRTTTSSSTPDCTFARKAANAEAAGAVAVIIFNEGNIPERTGVISGTLGSAGAGIPVVGTSHAVGLQLANGASHGSTGSTARVRVDFVAEIRTTRNVIAETPGGDPNRVVLVGAPLDSDLRGPGINAASGAAAMLEVAEVFAGQERDPRNRLRFVWFGAQEIVPIGAAQYAASLPAAERNRIAVILSLSRLGSPNSARFLFDGALGPAGSRTVERLFLDYFAAEGLAVRPAPATGWVHQAFDGSGIPVGGLFAGAEGLKSAAEEGLFGGVAGQPYDPCMRLACDTYANVNGTVLDQLSDAAAHAILLLSKRNFARDPLVSP